MTIYYAVVEGDPLDNGGNSRVLEGAPHSVIADPNGRFRAQTHLGQAAWCSVCESAGVIVAGAGISEQLRGYDFTLNAYRAVGGDTVICKCTHRPRIISVYARNRTYIDMGHASYRATPERNLLETTTRYDEQFTIRDQAGHPIAAVHYRVHIGSNIVATGVTDATGRTERITTDGSRRLRLEVRH